MDENEHWFWFVALIILGGAILFVGLISIFALGVNSPFNISGNSNIWRTGFTCYFG